MNFINEEECVGVKNDGGLITKAIREVEIMCLAGNIPESIDIDVTNLELGESIRLTEISLPEGSEISGLTEETDQMVVSVNAQKLLRKKSQFLKKVWRVKKVLLKKVKALMRKLIQKKLKAKGLKRARNSA